MKKCLNCGKENNSCYKDFCSLSCINKEKGKISILDYNNNPNKCLYCNKEILHIKGSLYETRVKKFCCRSCSAKFYNEPRKKSRIDGNIIRSEKTKQRWINIIENGLFEPQMNQRQVKKYYIEKRGYKCEECGIEEWNSKPITIELHHIDGDCTNQNDNNVILLCPNCHSQTNTYKSKNKNSTRRR